MKDNEIVFAEAYGNKVHNGTDGATTQTLFQLGSTTKVFTATATLQLINENVMTLDTVLNDALPTLDLGEQHSGWQGISVHHMLTHQGGFQDWVDWQPGSGLMDYALNTYPSFAGQINPAGKFWNYSNPNLFYLGAIIEHQRGLPYEQVMKQSVFEPLGMTRTTMTFDDVKADGDNALGVGNISAEFLEQISQPTFGKPAGGYTWSTPSEMVKMGQFLLNKSA
jgi:CubicO group peptidase (beta-lactamase class C family)